MTVPARTAEWLCTRCGTTIRKLVAADTSQTRDRCAHCHAKHIVEPDTRPVRWRSRIDG
jgi:DNA-directed RNA polymerase subunit RPC12/RpoP